MKCLKLQVKADLYMTDLVGPEIQLAANFVDVLYRQPTLDFNLRKVLSVLLVNWFIGFQD